MIPEPETIYVIDERATRRARRIVQTMNELEARGKGKGPRYASLKAELEGLQSRPKSGITVNVPRM